MSLDGLRAWIGEVERKLGKRTRVFLALSVIAIGIAGASVYLAIDARNDSVSESDVQALQEELETRIDALSATATTPPTGEPEAAEPETQKKGSTGGGGTAPPAGSKAKLRERLEETKEKAEELE